MKNTDIQNRLYGVMHTDMVPVTPAFVTEPAVPVNDSSLLSQMERVYGLPTMQRHAMEAACFLAGVVDKSPVEISKIVGDYSKLALVQNVNADTPDAMWRAVVAAAVLTTARDGAQTAMEKLEGALDELSKRYQADW